MTAGRHPTRGGGPPASGEDLSPRTIRSASPPPEEPHAVVGCPVTSRVTWGSTAVLDGFRTGPDHDVSWLEACPRMDESVTVRLAAPVGVILSGRRGYDAARAQADVRDELTAEAYGGAWSGIEIVRTHRPQEIADDPAITALDADVVDAVRWAQELVGPSAGAEAGLGRIYRPRRVRT